MKPKIKCEMGAKHPVGTKTSGCPQGICISVSARTCNYRTEEEEAVWGALSEQIPHNIRTHNGLYLIEIRKKVRPSEGSDKENHSLDLDSRCIEKV